MNPKMRVFMICMTIMVSGFNSVQSKEVLMGEDLTIMVDGSGKGRESIDPHAFDGLARMTGLTLARNKLTGLEAYVFPKLDRLKNLDLSNNNLSNTTGSFVNLGSVETLDLSNNEFKQLGSQYLFGLSKKSEIILGDGHKLDKIFGDVFVSETEHVESTKEEEQRPKRSNTVKSQADSFKLQACVENGVLVKLIGLEVGATPSPSDTSCTDVSYEAGLIKIHQKINKFAKGWCCDEDSAVKEFLDNEAEAYRRFGFILSGTGISEIEEGTFDKMPDVTFLDLSSNGLNDLKIVDNLPSSVQDLIIKNNSISAIPANAFSNLKQIRTLDLTLNKIKKIEPHAFKDNEHLTVLRLNGNELLSLEKDVFDGLVALKNLILASNQLTELIPDVFNLPQLERFDVSANGIKVIQSGAFESLKNIRDLKLRNNAIEKLQAGAFFGIPQKRTSVISVRNTPIKSLHGGLFEKSP